MALQLAKDTITEADLEELASWLTTKPAPRLTQGPLTAEFEEAWAAWLGVKHAVFVNSGSSALLLAYASLIYTGRLRSKRALVPHVAWPTTVAPAVQLGLLPIMGLTDEATWGLSPKDLKACCREHNPALVTVVDVLGVPADRDALLAMKSHYGFALIEDCCGAHGSTWRGQRVGTFGDLSCFSFYFAHCLSTVEGGMVCTNDSHLDTALRMLRSHGWTADLAQDARERIEAAWDVSTFRRKFTFYLPGFNVRGDDIRAKLGLIQMRRIDRAVADRALCFQAYREAFRTVSEVTVPEPAECSVTSAIGFGFLASTSPHRDGISERLAKAEIEHRPIGGGDMTLQPFMDARAVIPALDPVASRIHDCAIQVPSHPGVTPEDIASVVSAVKGSHGP